MATTGTLAAIRSTIEPVLQERGYDLEQLDLTPAGRRQVLRVVVDRDGGLDLDAVAAVSRAVSAALDRADPVAGGYLLEVSSPGVDRALELPRHWRRAVGRLVDVKHRDGAQLHGRVCAADETGVSLKLADGERRFEFGELGRGRVQVEFAAAGE